MTKRDLIKNNLQSYKLLLNATKMQDSVKEFFIHKADQSINDLESMESLDSEIITYAG